MSAYREIEIEVPGIGTATVRGLRREIVQRIKRDARRPLPQEGRGGLARASADSSEAAREREIALTFTAGWVSPKLSEEQLARVFGTDPDSLVRVVDVIRGLSWPNVKGAR